MLHAWLKTAKAASVLSDFALTQKKRTIKWQPFVSGGTSEGGNKTGGASSALAATGILTGLAYTAYRKRKDDGHLKCCGIVGHVGANESVDVLLEGVQLLQNRGYDSAGIATIDNRGRVAVTKFGSRTSTSDCVQMLVNEAPARHKGHKIGIAHTRWATHGAKTDANAHPHSDWKHRIALVHNGTITNYAALKERCIRSGATFKSETDSEVIANLIGTMLDTGSPFEEAVEKAVKELVGTWGLCVIHRDNPDRIVLARNGSPLLVGSCDNQVFVASEPLAMARHTNQFVPLRDGEIAVVTKEGIEHLTKTRPLEDIPEEHLDLSPAPYKHWTIKEIHEQPQSIARALNYGGRVSASTSEVKLGGLDDHTEDLMRLKTLLLAGCGTSLHAAMYGEALMRSLGSFESVRSTDASEMNVQTFPKDASNHGLLMLSQSGETLDLIKACQLADSCGIRKMSIVNAVGSMLARMTSCGVYLNAGREVAVASTKAFTSQVTVLALVALWFAQHKTTPEYRDRLEQLVAAVHRLPLYAGMALQTEKQIEKMASSLKDAKSMFFLGKGFAHPVALEGALKVKEVSYVHAEGFAGGALKHGPFALIENDTHTPVVLLIFNDEHKEAMLSAAEQVKARGARIIAVTDCPDDCSYIADDVIRVPHNGPLTALLSTIPLQLLAYKIAIAKGVDPDKPRGLAKTVTVC